MIEINLNDIKRVIHCASLYLDTEQHSEDCPVRHGASVDCCWPISICVPDDFWENYKKYKEISENMG